MGPKKGTRDQKEEQPSPPPKKRIKPSGERKNCLCLVVAFCFQRLLAGSVSRHGLLLPAIPIPSRLLTTRDLSSHGAALQDVDHVVDLLLARLLRGCVGVGGIDWVSPIIYKGGADRIHSPIYTHPRDTSFHSFIQKQIHLGEKDDGVDRPLGVDPAAHNVVPELELHTAIFLFGLCWD